MTVSVTDKRNDYTATAGQTSFPFTVRIFVDTDLKVYVNDVLKSLTTDYTVTIGANPNNGGTVDFVSGLTAGDKVAIVRDVPADQGADYTAYGKFPAETHEKGLDKLTVLVQQLLEKYDRALKLAESSTYSDLDFPDPEANKYLQWKSDSTGLQNVTLTTSGALAVTAFIETLLDDGSASEARNTLGASSGVWPVSAGGTGVTTLPALAAALDSLLAPLLAPLRDWRGKNAIINGNFDIWQRGTSNSTTALGTTLLADRWAHESAGSAINLTLSRQAHTLGQTDVPGEPAYFSRIDVTAATSLTKNRYRQRIEGVRSYAGQTVTVSWYMKADAARNVTPSLVQNFGTGGSPSSAVTTAGTAIDLTTSWQKFTQTFTVPGISGKTLGSSNDDYLELRFDLPAAVSTIDIDQVQIEAGSVATDFERRHIAQELALCQRYYTAATGFAMLFSGNVTSGGDYYALTQFPVGMRAAPTATVTSAGATNFPGAVGTVVTNTRYIRENRLASGTGIGFYGSSYAADAEL